MKWHERKFWIFDMDGTLTVAAHDFDAIRAELGLPQGTPILEQLAGLPGPRAAGLRRRLDGIERRIAAAAKPQPGARRLLETLAAGKARLGILTRNSHANALLTLARCRLDDLFDPADVLGRESCDPKPSPDGIRRLLARWGADPGRAVMVGDYLFDLQAGRQAGTATVHVVHGGENEWPGEADVAVENLERLRELVGRPA